MLASPSIRRTTNLAALGRAGRPAMVMRRFLVVTVVWLMP